MNLKVVKENPCQAGWDPYRGGSCMDTSTHTPKQKFIPSSSRPRVRSLGAFFMWTKQGQRPPKRGHVSAFSYIERQTVTVCQTNNWGPNCIWRDKQNQEKGLVLESKTGKPKCILHKTLCWISSKLTPADASRNCASFCIRSRYCADAKLSAIAVSLPSTDNLFLITKQPRDKNSEPCQQILLGFRN